MPEKKCPTTEELSGYLLGMLPENDAEAIADHVENCQPCEATVVNLEAESNTVFDKMRQKPANDPYAEESDCERIVALVAELGKDSTIDHAG